jgi:outer membrane protein OmpA-like peptidoglycan-associated protein
VEKMVKKMSKLIMFYILYSTTCLGQEEIKFVDSCFSSVSFEGRRYDQFEDVCAYMTGKSKDLVVKNSNLFKVNNDSIYSILPPDGKYPTKYRAIKMMSYYELQNFKGEVNIIGLDPYAHFPVPITNAGDKRIMKNKGFLALRLVNQVKKNIEYNLSLTFLVLKHVEMDDGTVEVYANSKPQLEGSEQVGSFIAHPGKWQTQTITIEFNKKNVKWLFFCPKVREIPEYSDPIFIAAPCFHLTESLEASTTLEPRVITSDSLINKTIILKNLEFSTNKSEIESVSFEELNTLADHLNKNVSYTIALMGYTDNIGKEEDNQRLSEARAKAVANYLASKGIKMNRIEYKGNGSALPIASNETEQGRTANRRVTFKISEK